MKAYRLTIAEASELISGGKLTPTELLESVFGRIERLEPKLEAWVSLDKEGAMDTAEGLTVEAEEGMLRSPIHGIPIGVKDIYYTEGIKTTMGSPLYRDFVPSYDAETVKVIKEAGAVIPGKTETTEFAAFDPAPTRNPWNLEHTPGGSSSGSAAAVSSGMVPAALGSQTGGSVIRPAAFCGIVGMKPTYDLINRCGVFPLSWSLDHVGFFTRSVEDARIMLDVLAGKSMTQVSAPEIETVAPRLGLLRGYFQENAHEEVWLGLEAAVEKLRDAGAEVLETPLPESFEVVHAAYSLIFASEAASVHEEEFRRRRSEYRLKMRSQIAAGLLVPASAYLRAKRIRGRFIMEVEALLRGVDCVLTPSSVTPALRGLESTGDPAFNSPWSFCGFPVISLPCGLTKDELPLGIQFTGRPFREGELLAAAGWCEGVLKFPNTPRDP
ncbi:MAG: amidase [Candidatus Bathyarchaeota archaeon]|nr:MAG: amidase [Candidatus Bathyarchaeota archaeon]